jgi:hypothetical protein
MHPCIQEQEQEQSRTGASERSGTGVERHMVMSGEEARAEQKPRALDGFVVWLSPLLARDLPEPRGFRCALPTCARAPPPAHEAAGGLIEWKGDWRWLFRYTLSTLLNKAEE